MNSLTLSERRRCDVSIELVRGPDELYSWRMTDVAFQRLIAISFGQWRDLSESVRDCHRVTGWLPDGFAETAQWDDDAPGVRRLDELCGSCARPTFRGDP